MRSIEASPSTATVASRLRQEADTMSDDCIPHDIVWMPGATGVFFQPAGDLGAFAGGDVQFAPYHLYWHQNLRVDAAGGVSLPISEH